MQQLLGDLMQMMGTGMAGGGARVELARTLAHGVAAAGEPEANVDPVERIALEELVRLAEMHVTELTCLQVSPVEVMAVPAGSWAWHTVEDWRFLLEAATETAPAGGATPGAPGSEALDLGGLLGSGTFPGGAEDEGRDPTGELVARWMTTMGPMLAAMQLGSAIGHLARATLGPYELPVPRRAGDRLLIVPANIARFAEDWSLPIDQVRLWVCLREVTTHAVLCRPHVSDRIRELLVQLAEAGAPDTAGMMQRLEGMDPSDPETLQRLVGDPEALIESTPSPRQARAAEELAAVTAALLGFVEHVLDEASRRLLGGRGALAEAWRRRQVAREPGDRAAEALVGFDLGPTQLERGVGFVGGVLDRAGEDGLARLWDRASTLPTPTEIDAPGLWLERISFDGDQPA